MLVKTLIGYAMIGLVKLLGYVPLSVAQAMGRAVGLVLYRRRTRTREVARVNLSLTYPELTPAERETLLRDTLLENGMIGGEMGPMWGYSAKKGLGLIRQVHGEELLDEALASGKGVMLMAPHLGNWEIINNYMATKAPITIMYRPAKIKIFNDWMVARREAVGCHLVPTTRDGVMALFRLLKQGQVIGMLPDQEPKPERGVFAPFMGVETLTPKLPHELLQKTGALTLFAFAERLPAAQGFAIHLVRPGDGIYDADPRVSAMAMNATIERCVEHCPAQYQWTYKRFKRRPDGARDPYKEARVP